ncbi:MAG: hypothetical protein ABI903_16495 [Actinomycetota bacterium]
MPITEAELEEMRAFASALFSPAATDDKPDVDKPADHTDRPATGLLFDPREN